MLSSLQLLVVLGFFFILIFQFLLKKYVLPKQPAKKLWWASLVLFVLLITVMEILFSYWLYHPTKIPAFAKESYKYYYQMYFQHIAQFDSKISTYNKKLFYTLRPGVSGTFSNIEFFTKVTANKAGFRDDDESLEGPAIICVGDSFTFGWGVEQQQAFAQQLEKSTGEKVLNAGIPSYGTAREIISLSGFDLSRLKYLIIQYCTNDEDENVTFVKNHFSLSVSSRKEYEKITRGHKINTTYFPGENFLTISQIFAKEKINNLCHVFPLQEDHVIINNALIKRFLDIVAKAPVDFSKVKVLVFQSDGIENMDSEFARITDSLIHTKYYQSAFHNNLKVIDLTKILNKNDYYVLDAHFNKAGHKKVATAIEDQLRRFQD
jgi:lysophospholipase L1-like esterase